MKLKVSDRKANRLAFDLYKSSFPAFLRKVFQTVSPGHKYVHGWHIEAICEYLKACEQGEIKNLVINIPPRCMKTISVSVGWSAWLLGQNPSAQIIGASYSQNLAMKDNTNVRYVLESEWYKECFPDTVLADDQNEKRKFSTTKRGHRIATSVGGTLTGEGGDFLILDDPIKPDEALSETIRVKTNDWIDQVFSSRKNDPKTAVSVLIMQRLHEDDPTGHLLDKGWEHLCLPAEFTRDKTISIGEKRWDVEAGDILMPGRLGARELKQISIDLGSYAYAAQYGQNPAPKGGGLIKEAWLRFAPERPLAFNYIIHSWDTASKDGVLNDYSSCTVWGVKSDGHYLLEVTNKRLKFPELKKAVKDKASRDNPDYILIEDKASGQALIQELQSETQLPVVAIMPVNDKVTRLSMCSVEFETGNVILPEDALWAEDYVDQLTLFPNAKYDDMVDSTSQYLSWAKRKNLMSLSESEPPDADEYGVPTFNTMLKSSGNSRGRR